MSEGRVADAKGQGADKRGLGRDGVRARSPYYIQATSPQADELGRVLKHGDTFAIFDHYGDITPAGLGEEGIYHEGTRFLSRLILALEGGRPLFLSSTVKEDNDLLAIDLTNPDLAQGGEIVIGRGALYIARTKLLRQGSCYERLYLKNYGLAQAEILLSFGFGADFADIFEVRGNVRKQRGRHLEPAVGEGTVLLPYRGLDGVVRATRLLFSPAPAEMTAEEAHFQVALPPHGDATLYLTIGCEIEGTSREYATFDHAAAASAADLAKARIGSSTIRGANEQFNAWIRRTVADVHMMITETPEGPYPYAGIPWFNTPFGRDGILTAFECLWIDPGLARGVLAYLAANQATHVIPEQDAEPGKILHETRRGEMAALGEIPFGCYYGSVDATPLFVMLAAEYFRRTADRAFVESIWPNIESALHWIDRYGDRDGDGFVEYSRQSSRGLVHQGWKDSHDAIFHADGSLAQGPIALCEVQGYVYAARRGAAHLASVLGHTGLAQELENKAIALQERFERVFWSEEIGTYVLALDGNKQPCKVRTSNAGQCLLAGIVSAERARRVAQVLLDSDSYSGWGIRTLAAGQVRYNPMSYHNGSVWPHDNALIASGLARYGLKDEVERIMAGLFDASLTMDLHRLPELFCGFVRRAGEGPTHYPVACAPQSWSAAAAFLLLQACLGLSIRVPEAEVCFEYPILPPSLKSIEIENIRMGEGSVDLLLQRHGDDVGVNVLRRKGKIEVRVVK